MPCDIIRPANGMPDPLVGQDIGDWLEGLGLGRYRALFAEHDIDADVLADLSETDLERLGISLGHRKKLLRVIAGIAQGPPLATVENREGERRQLTVMFCDLVGSTALSARIDPEEMHDVVERYYGAIADTVAQFDGFIARYLGDGALVYFGWPRADESDAERAIRAGLALVAAVQTITADQHKLQVRIGIATGLVVIGNTVGVGTASEQLAVGDTLNLAARLQTAAAPDSVVIADATRRLIGRLFDLEPIGPLDLKGIAAPTITWRVRGESAVHSRFAAVRTATRASLVAREAEIKLLLEHWRAASQGRGSAVVLVGEAGIGKSRVAQELLDRLAGESHRRALFQCSPLHAHTAFYPVIHYLEQAIALRMDDTPDRRLDKLAARLESLRMDRAATPLLAELLSLPRPAGNPLVALSPHQHKARMLGALVDYFVALARLQPLVMLLEDAHWIDPTTRDLVDALLARIEQVPVLLVVTARPGFALFAGGDRVCTEQMMHRLEPAEAAPGGWQQAVASGARRGSARPHRRHSAVHRRTDAFAARLRPAGRARGRVADGRSNSTGRDPRDVAGFVDVAPRSDGAEQGGGTARSSAGPRILGAAARRGRRLRSAADRRPPGPASADWAAVLRRERRRNPLRLQTCADPGRRV